MPTASLRAQFWRRSFFAFAGAFFAAAVFASASSRRRFSSGDGRGVLCLFVLCVAVGESV
eukprot:2101824-Pyramimonas_sp.AAC.1